MKIFRNQRSRAAFSWMELLVVIVTVMLVFVVLSMLLPGLANRNRRSPRIQCVSNLKQIGLAARMWSNDNGEKFPWAVSTNKGGTLEFAASPEVFCHFVAMSNELSSPKVLVCPSDRERLRATTFMTPLANSNVSYFVGLDADETRPQTILSGDRNIIGGVTNGAWMVFRATNTPSWGSDIHNLQGNIGLGDGSVQQFTTNSLAKQFQAALATQTNPVIRLAIPRTSADQVSGFSSFRLSPMHLVAVAVALAALALWIVIRRGLLAASANGASPTKAEPPVAPPRGQ